MNSTLEPKLAPPGAGLSAPELFVARALFAWKRLTRSRDVIDSSFRRERQIIDGLVSTCDSQAAARRVLIDRVRGLEDSSRYWSVWMTLDHLRIVHRAITHTIAKLSRGAVPEGKASTAAVKPDPRVTAEVVSQYEKSADDLLTTVASIPNLKTDLRYAHPWFGPLDAAGWHALAAGHLKIHRMQIERIIQGLRSTGI